MTRPILATALLALAACGPKPAATTTPPPIEQTAPPSAAPTGPIYAKLFVEGTTWRFSVHTEDSEYNPDDPEASEDGVVSSSEDFVESCRVARVATFGDVQASEILCGESWPSDELPGGIWLATADGLWRTWSWPDDGVPPELEADDMMLAAAPVAANKEIWEPGYSDEEPIGETAIEAKGDGWCWSESVMAGDGMWRSICFDAAGVTGGGTAFSGGSDHEMSFDRVD